jgi:hypothetical protein
MFDFWAGSAVKEHMTPSRIEDIAALRSVGYNRELLTTK